MAEASSSRSTSTATPSSGSSTPTATPANRPWKRVLYEKQPYPDWHFPRDEIATTISRGPRGSKPFTHLSVLVALLPLIQNINVIFLFLEVFNQLESGTLHPARLTFWCLTAIVIGGLTARLFTGNRKKRRSKRRQGPSEIISFAILLLLLYALSPVLKTLTEATTSDTIYPLAFILFGLHVCLAENILRTNEKQDTSSSQLQQQGQLSSALSLNAATSASLVLASRLPHNAHVFALMFTAILAFAFFPALVSKSKRPVSKFAVVCVLVGLAIGSACINHQDSTTFLAVTTVNGFLMVIVPFWMCVGSRRKTRYDGPWKVATPQFKRS